MRPRFGCDERGRVTSWTDSNDPSYTDEYDDRGRCIAASGSHGHMALRLSYGETDPTTGHRVTTTVTGEGHSRQYHINRHGQVVAETDPLGTVTRFERDRRGNLLSRAGPLGHTTAYRCDTDGNLISVVRPDGRESRAAYDNHGLPVKVTGPDGTPAIRGERPERGQPPARGGHRRRHSFRREDLLR